MENLDKTLVELGKEISGIKSGIKKLHTELQENKNNVELVAFKRTDNISDISKGLIEFHSKIKSVEKTSVNPFFKSNYATLDSILEYIRPILSECKLSVIQLPIQADNNGVAIKTILMSESGQYIESDSMAITPPKLEAQAFGSVITYTRRYSLGAILSLSFDLDTDGNDVSPQNTGQTKPKSTTRPTTRAGRI